MKEIQCAQILQNAATQILEDTGLVDVLSVKSGRQSKVLLSGQTSPDFTIDVRKKGTKRDYSLLFEVKSLGQPLYVRMAANQLQSIVAPRKNSYGVFGAPYLSEESMAICRENGIGFLDVAGNCFLKFEDIYIDIQGQPNPYPTTRPLKSLFAAKSSRAQRALLCNPDRAWSIIDLVAEANISLGQASNVKRKLFEQELITEAETGRRGKFRLRNPEALLRKWAATYSYRQNRLNKYYSLNDVREIETELASFCENKRIRYAFTLTSGASLVAPSLRYGTAFAYVGARPDSMAKALGWKEVSSGENVTLLQPYDDGVFYGLQDVGGARVVSDTQLYLDLQSYKGRGQEAADSILERRLRTQW